MRRPHTAPAICTLLSLTVALAACGSSHPHSAAGPPAGQRSGAAHTSRTTQATAPASAAATASPAPSTASSVAASVLPGVVADCLSRPPYRLSARPGTITLACADDGLGVEHMTWGSWAHGAATGQGRLWEKLCHPNCAEGKIGTYPARVTLSAVKPSSAGPWFSRLTVTLTGQRPPGTLPGSFGLMKP